MENELTTSAKCTEVGLAHWKGWKESSAVSLVFLVFPLIDLMTKVNRVLPRDILQIPKSCKCSNVWPVEKVITLCLPPKVLNKLFHVNLGCCFPFQVETVAGRKLVDAAFQSFFVTERMVGIDAGFGEMISQISGWKQSLKIKISSPISSSFGNQLDV